MKSETGIMNGKTLIHNYLYVNNINNVFLLN